MKFEKYQERQSWSNSHKNKRNNSFYDWQGRLQNFLHTLPMSMTLRAGHHSVGKGSWTQNCQSKFLQVAEGMAHTIVPREFMCPLWQIATLAMLFLLLFCVLDRRNYVLIQIFLVKQQLPAKVWLFQAFFHDRRMLSWAIFLLFFFAPYNNEKRGGCWLSGVLFVWVFLLNLSYSMFLGHFNPRQYQFQMSPKHDVHLDHNVWYSSISSVLMKLTEHAFLEPESYAYWFRILS
jgi:hypothetical protein